MKLLLIDQFSDIGGAQQSFLELLPALVHAGWCVHAAIPGEGRFKAGLQASGAVIHRIPCGPYGSGNKSITDVIRFGADFWKQRRLLSRLVASERYDLVYVNGPRVLPAAALAIGRSRPIVFHAHNAIGRGRLLSITGRCLRACRANVIACCEFVAHPLRTYITDCRMHVIRNGTQDMRPSMRSSLPRTPFVVGIIGRIEPQKGQLDLLQALALLAAQGLEIQPVICGAATSQSHVYAREVKRLGTSLNARFLGWREDIAAVLSDLDMLIIPSTNEAFPRVMIEAFSASIPVLAFNVGGIAEAIENNRTGFLLDPPSISALAARIAALAREPETLASVARRSRTLWENQYDVATYRSRITELLARAVFPA